MQHLISIYREGDVEKEAKTEDLPFSPEILLNNKWLIGIWQSRSDRAVSLIQGFLIKSGGGFQSIPNLS